MEANSSSAGDDRFFMDMGYLTMGLHPIRAGSEGGVKLFGVSLTHDSTAVMMRKAVSMGNLSSYNSPHALNALHSRTPEGSESGEPGPADPPGYVSDGLVQNCGSLRERKKGVPWTEDEHRMFLVGLQKLGKGDWRGIARNFVPSRTPTQVASHAQKYFLRQSNLNKRKRRSSLFDMISSNPASTVSNLPDHVGSYATELNLPSSTRVSADLHLGVSDEAHREQHPQVQRWCYKFSPQQQHAGVPLGTQVPPETTKLLPLTIDEAPELATSLTLSIGQPLLLEPTTAELTPKLEQASPTRHLAIGESTNNSSSYTNAIRVV
ncbi:hypothetical protein GOP47_0021678 [Adiantum capillus-veneris]|uniref:Uncharacterized protein n=1 Tax=Adiantum capillus-veneris TaxID=13818 RepID=A0A9D4Z834_ADICA|nr:hypothetical protein GOP47_0021678 [Adiantum capillus-veneris]